MPGGAPLSIALEAQQKGEAPDGRSAARDDDLLGTYVLGHLYDLLGCSASYNRV